MKQKRGVFFSRHLGTIGASSFGNMLPGQRMIRAGDGVHKDEQQFLMSPHSLTNFEMHKYY